MNEQVVLFESAPESAAVVRSSPGGRGIARVLVAERNQIALRALDLDATIGLDHPARNVWAFVEGMEQCAGDRTANRGTRRLSVDLRRG